MTHMLPCDLVMVEVPHPCPGIHPNVRADGRSTGPTLRSSVLEAAAQMILTATT